MISAVVEASLPKNWKWSLCPASGGTCIVPGIIGAALPRCQLALTDHSGCNRRLKSPWRLLPHQACLFISDFSFCSDHQPFLGCLVSSEGPSSQPLRHLGVLSVGLPLAGVTYQGDGCWAPPSPDAPVQCMGAPGLLSTTQVGSIYSSPWTPLS